MQSIELRHLTDSVTHAVSRDATRYTLGRILLEPDPEDAERMLVVATDGHRLAVASSPVSMGLKIGLLVDPIGAKTLPKARARGGYEKIRAHEVTAYTNGTANRYMLRAGEGAADAIRNGASITEGKHTVAYEYPNWRQILPKTRKPSGLLHITDDALDMLAGLSHCTTYVKLSAEGETLLAEQSKPGFSAKLELGKYDGKPFDPVGFTASYLCDALRFARNRSGYCTVQWNDPLRPIVFGDAYDYTLVMPARL